MAENIEKDDEALENAEGSESKPPFDTSNSSIEADIIVPIQETDNMETHAHHLHHAPGKKIWHYFYEFLMLFLAVICGFLAENSREHYVEHQREIQYASQLVADLKADSIQFARLYADMSRVINKQDMFINVMSSPEAITDKEVISAFIPLQWAYKVSKTSSTYNQMKTSGSLRYIRNKDLVNSMQRYYEIMLPYFDAMADQSMRIYTSYLEPFSLDHFNRGDIDINSDTLINKNPVYRNRTPESDFKLRNIIVIYREYLSMSLDRFLADDIKKVNELIDAIEKEYKLE